MKKEKPAGLLAMTVCCLLLLGAGITGCGGSRNLIRVGGGELQVTKVAVGNVTLGSVMSDSFDQIKTLSGRVVVPMQVSLSDMMSGHAERGKWQWTHTHPASLRKEETVLTVQLKVTSGSPEALEEPLGKLDAWVTDEKGHKNSSRSALVLKSTEGKFVCFVWLFGVPKGSKSFTLHLPGGESIGLRPYMVKEKS